MQIPKLQVPADAVTLSVETKSPGLQRTSWPSTRSSPCAQPSSFLCASHASFSLGLSHLLELTHVGSEVLLGPPGVDLGFCRDSQ